LTSGHYETMNAVYEYKTMEIFVLSLYLLIIVSENVHLY
jgi:hypothetical protein